MIPLLLAVDIRNLASHADALAKTIPPDRQERMGTYRLQADRLRSLAGSLLMGRITAGGSIEYGEFGKPYVDGGPHFNIAHSGDYAVMAVSDCPIGVDIEEHHEEDCLPIADVSFHPDERRFLAENYGTDLFYDMWTLKESYMKMCGKGFSLDPTAFCLIPTESSARLVLPEQTNHHFRLYHTIPGHSLAVCTANSAFDKTITWLQF